MHISIIFFYLSYIVHPFLYYKYIFILYHYYPYYYSTVTPTNTNTIPPTTTSTSTGPSQPSPATSGAFVSSRRTSIAEGSGRSSLAGTHHEESTDVRNKKLEQRIDEIMEQADVNKDGVIR